MGLGFSAHTVTYGERQLETYRTFSRRPQTFSRNRRELQQGMARHRGLNLQQVDVHVITAPTLRLDREQHRGQLLQTAQQLRPRLLPLDPLVRLHGIDENNASEVAELLAYFRALQRQLDLSVIYLELVASNAQTAHLEVVAEPQDQKPTNLSEQVLSLLTDGTVLTRARLRDLLGVKTSVWARPWSPWSKPANYATRPPVGNALTDGRRIVPVPPYRERGNGTELPSLGLFASPSRIV